jgi:excisionase family DNA binding protein
MTIREAAQRIGKHNDTIRRAIQAGKLEAIKVKGVWDIPEEALTAYAEAQGISDGAAGIAQPYDDDMQLRMQNEKLTEQINELRAELKQERERLEEARRAAEEASQRHDTIVLQLTRQLEGQQRLLEYHQEPWYRKWFRRGKNMEEKAR